MEGVRVLILIIGIRKEKVWIFDFKKYLFLRKSNILIERVGSVNSKFYV